MIDRDRYFEYVRAVLFEGALSQQQVDGQNVILALWEGDQTGTPMDDERWLAYMLATTFHETGFRMWPVVEQGGEDYLGGKDYYPYYGRGYVQLTWLENYANASAALGLIDDRDLVEHPELALDSLIGARIMFRGMAEGWFTGKKLGQYFNDTDDDPVNARQIINGNDKDTEIAAYYEQFLHAILEASDAPPPAGEGILTLSLDGLPEGYDVKLVLDGKQV
jgi:putative chitinase